MLQLQDMGAPTTDSKDGPILDTTVAPQLVPAIIETARQAYIQDWEANRVPAPVSMYVRNAIQTLGVQTGITGGEDYIPFNESPSLTWSGQGNQGQSQSLPVVTSDADYEALEPGTRFQDENGDTFTKPGA
jgi:hypothetical protein